MIRAPKDGLVIYPQGEEWKDEPEVSEGSTAHNDQVLLQMPDLSQMHVNVGIHESMIESVRPGMKATVTLPHGSLEGKVKSIASVAEPAGWWTGNIVKYDAVVQLPTNTRGLKPGMSAELQITLDEHEGVLLVPLSAVDATTDGTFCWVGSPDQAERRPVKLGASNDDSIVVEEGLNEGEQVVLNPQQWIQNWEIAKRL